MVAFPRKMQPCEHSILPCFLPDRFVNSKRQNKIKARKEVLKGGLFTQFIAEPINHYFYSLHLYEHFGLPKSDEEEYLIYDHKHLNILKHILAKHFQKPYYYCFQVGIEGRLHVHLIADKYAGLLDLKRDTEVIKPVYDFAGLLAYFYEPPVSIEGLDDTEILRRLNIYEEFKHHIYPKKLPRTRDLIGMSYKPRVTS